MKNFEAMFGGQEALTLTSRPYCHTGADLTVGELGGRLGRRRLVVYSMQYVLVVDRVLATRAPGRKDVGAPRLANHLHPPTLSKNVRACQWLLSKRNLFLLFVSEDLRLISLNS